MKPDKTQGKILIVDDNPQYLMMISNKLEQDGYYIYPVPNGKEAIKIANAVKPDLILLDIRMDEMDGFEVCRRLKNSDDPDIANIPVIFITSFGETNGAKNIIEGFRVGGADYITKGSSDDELFARVENHLKIQRLAKELRQRTIDLEQKNQEMLQEIEKRKQADEARKIAEEARRAADEQLSLISEQEAIRWGIENFVGKSATIKDILDKLRKLQNADIDVLIIGETGTGKELIARAIHKGSSRSTKRFMAINCAAIPETLIESHFFGSIKGAFTGAVNSKGYFEKCSDGTLFLDEIGDMPLQMQVKLLRVLDEGYYTPVGATEPKKSDVRIITATNADLEAMIKEKKFREELYYRITGYVVKVPPLRERRGDIPLLIEHFRKIWASDMGKEHVKISAEAYEILESYHFPGNVRELEKIIQRALIDCSGDEILPTDLELRSSGEKLRHSNRSMESIIAELYEATDKYSHSLVDNFERCFIEYALKACGWNTYKTADRLKMDRSNLIKLKKRLGINNPNSERNP
jgi:DNA-binding NtrC family response regulator